MAEATPVSIEETELMLARAEASGSGPSSQKLPPGRWIKQNLFNNVPNTIITIVFGVVGLILTVLALQWALGADYAIVRANLRLFMIGQFPKDELWRPWVSGFVLVAGFGFLSGALGHNTYDANLAKDLPAAKSTWLELLRRFWAIAAVLVFFVSFARTILPYIGLAAAFAILVLSREVGWRLSVAIRERAVYIGSVLFVISMLVIAGTSQLGGYALGLIAAVWAVNEVGRRDLGEGIRSLVIRWGVPLLAAVVVFTIEVLIPHDGIGWENWGGLHITLFTTVLGIALGMPFGILLALGRRSELPVLKTASVIFIEFIRGVPLISLLLFSTLMLPLFLPGERPADLSLAIIVITGFSAAYIAEIVRGGLQAVPKGQTEAAQASGMSAGSVQRLI
ncbi:MAG: ABC transporter permease subunit, partial [Actinomycetia bacterium]|nr:ABC transporter permease subunit [Actinomycetes bacterium]